MYSSKKFTSKGSFKDMKSGYFLMLVAEQRICFLIFFKEETMNSISSSKPNSNDLSNSSNTKV